MDEEQQTPQAPQTPPSPSASEGLDPKIGGLLAYLFGWVSGLILYLISKDKYIRFHALQSIFIDVGFVAIWIALFVVEAILSAIGLGIIAVLLGLVSLVVIILYVIARIFMMIKGYTGYDSNEYFKLPIIGDMAEKSA